MFACHALGQEVRVAHRVLVRAAAAAARVVVVAAAAARAAVVVVRARARAAGARVVAEGLDRRDDDVDAERAGEQVELAPGREDSVSRQEWSSEPLRVTAKKQASRWSSRLVEMTVCRVRSGRPNHCEEPPKTRRAGGARAW